MVQETVPGWTDEFLVQVYKWITLPYSSGALASELTLLLLLVAVDALRIQLGKRGNLTDKKAPLVASVFLLAPSVLAVLYRYRNGTAESTPGGTREKIRNGR